MGKRKLLAAVVLIGTGGGWLAGFLKEPGPRPAATAEAAEPAPAAAPAPPPAKKPAPNYRSVRIDGVPHVRQKPDFCGEACAAMYLAGLGHAIDQDDVFDQADLDPVLGRGCHTRELAHALTRIGFQVGPAWFRAAAERADEELAGLFRALHADLAAGVPSIVCMHYDDQPETSEHFRLVLGYDAAKDEVLYHEPAVARGAYQRMAREQFLQLWPLKYDEKTWTVIRLRLVPGTIRNVHSTARLTAADYAQQVMHVRRLAPEGFRVLIEKPFVVAGDAPAAEVQRVAGGTVAWAVGHLRREYFPQDPDDILAIWLFQDAESYNRNTAAIFHDAPDTPFGYYSHRHRALIMNIGTGTGTLVHEIVHPFIAANFPDCPSWFNEGLASLYEQCGENRGRIWGRTNWRLKGLQEAIQPPPPPKPRPQPKPDAPGASPAAADPAAAPPAAAPPEPEPEPPPELPSFQELCSTTTFQFYHEDRGTNYAQARYLCYYLQQRGLLRQFYHQFRRDVAQDPTGYETLQSVLGIEDEPGMQKFTESWKKWVLELRYP